MSLTLPPESNAEDAPDYPGLSRLAKHEKDILTFRRKRWPYRKILTWLEARGVKTSLGNLHRFYQCCLARNRKVAPPASIPNDSKPPEKPARPDLRWGIRED
jgi:hypothetical protein